MESLHRAERTQVYQNDIAQGLLTMPEAASKIGIHMAKQKKSRDQHPQPAFVFDLDGTLIDRVYQHILAWSEALRAVEIELSNWCIHRRIGMSDSLMLNTCMRGAGRKLDKKQIEKLQDLHTKAYMKQVDEVQALPGAKTLLEQLTKLGVLWAIGTTSLRERQKSLDMRGIGDDVTVVIREMT